MRNKTVFDTNVWVSYFLRGKFAELVDLVFEDGVDFYRAKELTEELRKVLNRDKFKKYLTLPVNEYISFYEDLSSLIEIKHLFSGCRDPKDNFLFDLAYQSKARFLVSGDKDVRETPITQPLNVVSLSIFKEMVSKRV